MTTLRRTEPAPPIRIAHLGLGNFFRAHQAYYTAAAPDAADWGIAAFTGRSRRLAETLSAQDGLFTLVVRGPEEDDCQVLTSVAAAHPGSDVDTWLATLSLPSLAILTLTVTEAGYPRAHDGGLAIQDPSMRTDIAVLREETSGQVATVPGRIVAGLAARRAAGGGPLAIVPCDNLPENGAVASRLVNELAQLVNPSLAAWIRENVSFVTTMVDRITPETTPADLATVTTLTGYSDAAPVVTEPFTEWVLQGSFPAGRPQWDAAGARFVDDIRPHEQRKLWLLNGGHSLLAYAGSALGHTTVAEAVADPRCRAWLDEWWNEAAAHLPLPPTEIDAYRAALLERWANPRIAHQLAQIASDGSQKLPVRILPVLHLERANDRLPPGAIRVVAAWIAHLRGAGAPVKDTAASSFVPIAADAAAVIALLDPTLANDKDLIEAVTAAL